MLSKLLTVWCSAYSQARTVSFWEGNLYKPEGLPHRLLLRNIAKLLKWNEMIQTYTFYRSTRLEGARFNASQVVQDSVHQQWVRGVIFLQVKLIKGH